MHIIKNLSFALTITSLLSCGYADKNDVVTKQLMPSSETQVRWHEDINRLLFVPSSEVNLTQLAILLRNSHEQYSLANIQNRPAVMNDCLLAGSEQMHANQLGLKQITPEYAITDEAIGVHTKDKVYAEILTTSKTTSANATNAAKAERLANKMKQALILQISALGQCVVDNTQHHVIFNTAEERVISSFFDLIRERKSFSRGDFEIYEIDQETKLFAYSLIHKKQRAFVAFNFSFDMHEIPLPFGFMSSTKVTFWQSDVAEASTFVTSSPLMINPFTVAIVIVE